MKIALRNFYSFGKAELSPDIINALKSKDLKTRVTAGIKPLVGKYVAARLNLMKLSTEEKQEWNKKLMERIQEGTKLYGKLRSTEEGRQLGWMFYGGCGACDGTKAGCEKVLISKKSEK